MKKNRWNVNGYSWKTNGGSELRRLRTPNYAPVDAL